MSNLIFFGTPDFAVPCLKQVHAFSRAKGHHLVGVVCQPDKPAERGQQLHEPPIKKLALELGLPVWQPAKIMSEFIDWFETQNIDLGVVVAYGKILPERLLKASRLGFVNVHGSLLPRWRGAAPIQRAVEAGDTETGICIMNLVPEMDAGEVYFTQKTPIGPSETSGELFERLAPLGANALIQALPGILDGSLKKIAQPETGITHARKVTKEEALINWSKPTKELVNHCLAMEPWPGNYTIARGKKLKLFRAHIVTCHPGPRAGVQTGFRVKPGMTKPGQILELGDKLVVATADGAIAFEEAQLEGRRRMFVRDLANGFPMQVGELLC